MVLFTITAPGIELLPWDQSKCSHGPDERCSGTLGCRVESSAASAWNANCSRQLSALVNAAQQRVRREGLRPPLIAAKVIQRQQRGVDHFHLVLGLGGDRRRIERFIAACEALASGYDFGYVDRKAKVGTGLHAANYLAGYLSRGGQLEAAVDGNRRRVFWIAPALTLQSGFTMSMCRRIRSVHKSLDSWRLAADASRLPSWLLALRPFMRPEMAAALRL